jgi:hypothetical protein
MRLLLALRNGFLDGLLNVLLGGGVVGQLGNALRDQDLNDGPEKDEQGFPHYGAVPLQQRLERRSLVSDRICGGIWGYLSGASLSQDFLEAKQSFSRQVGRREDVDRVVHDVEGSVWEFGQSPTTRAGFKIAAHREVLHPSLYGKQIGLEDESAVGAEGWEGDSQGGFGSVGGSAQGGRS